MINEFIATFHIDWKLMIAQIINFGLVFAVFYFLAAKPLSKLVKDRTIEIETGVANAKENAILLERSQKEYNDVLAKAKIEANKIFQEGKKDAEAKKAAMLEEARKEVEATIEKGKKSLQSEKVKIVEEAKKEIVSLAMAATEKILSEKQDVNNL